MITDIKQVRPDSADAVKLIDELNKYLEPLSPPESQHGYSIEKLIEQNVNFYLLKYEGKAAGCAGVQFFDPADERPFAEVKRMYIRPEFRGLGLAQALLAHLEKVTAEQGLNLLRLETGIAQKSAIKLYERWGFQKIGPFGPYTEDPNSLYFEKEVT